MMKQLLPVAIAAILFVGCDHAPTAIVGGTPGVLLSGGQPLSQTQVNVYQWSGNGAQVIGRGFAGANGEFELVNNDSSAPLLLEAGTYRFTVETIGAEINIPSEYATPELTPLKISYIEGEALKLELPEL